MRLSSSRFAKGSRVKVLVRNQKGKAVLDFKGIHRAGFEAPVRLGR